MRTIPFVLVVACSPVPSPDSSGPDEATLSRSASPEHTDGVLAFRTPSPDGRWEVRVADGGALALIGPDGADEVAPDALREVAFSPDGRRLVFARGWGDTDLWVVDVPPQGPPERLTDHPGPEDRPLFDPDGARLAYVSGASGIASVWILDLAAPDAPRQLTNVGVEQRPRAPGRPPEGFVPPPDGVRWEWTSEGLRWTADGQLWEVQP